MRIKFMIDPSARRRDLEEITQSYNLPAEGLKYLQWRNEYTVSKFFYTWKMIEDFFKTNLQVVNIWVPGKGLRLGLLLLAGHQQDSSSLLLSSQSFPSVSRDRSQRGPAERGQPWPASGHQLRVVHLTSLHGEPGQDQGDPGQVCRQSNLPHCLHTGLVSVRLMGTYVQICKCKLILPWFFPEIPTKEATFTPNQAFFIEFMKQLIILNFSIMTNK